MFHHWGSSRLINYFYLQEDPTSAGRDSISQSIVRQAFRRRNISEKATDLLIHSINESTWKHYQKHIQEWIQYCNRYNQDVFKPKLKKVLKILSFKYRQGVSYATLNTARSAIAFICGDRISKDRTISRFMKGVFKLKSKLRYKEVYNLDPIITRIRSMVPLSSLSLPELTERLVVLMALITAYRKQTLALIKITNITEYDGGFCISIPDPIKTFRCGAHESLLEVPYFKAKPNLCVATT